MDRMFAGQNAPSTGFATISPSPSFGVGAQNLRPIDSSVLESASARLANALSTLNAQRERACRIADAVFGPRPQPPENKGGNMPSMGWIATHNMQLDGLDELLRGLSDELDRLSCL